MSTSIQRKQCFDVAVMTSVLEGKMASQKKLIDYLVKNYGKSFPEEAGFKVENKPESLYNQGEGRN